MSDIHPFEFVATDEALEDLRRRLQATRWPDPEPVADWSQGIPVAYVQECCDYWLHAYDWRERESLLNRFPQFTTAISVDGCDPVSIHFLHVRSPHEDATPLLLTHGWPGSVVEFLDVIGPLSDPTAHGGNAADAFHVVCPSLPGYGFSGKPTEPGWGLGRIVAAWGELMARLGYDRFGAQGGDWGAMVTTLIGARNPEHCLGIHLNMPVVIPSTMEDLTESEQRWVDSMAEFRRMESGYSQLQSTRPETLGYGLADSPAGQCAWILEKFHAWTDNEGSPEDAVDRDRLLDNVMVYWLTNSAASSARLYWESYRSPPFEIPQVPVGCSVFPEEIMRPSRRWAEAQFGDRLVWFNELDRGGHFAAMEEPDLFVDEVRCAFRLMR
jgi:epoxide hydrolase